MKLVPAMVESGLITNSTKNFERSVKRYYSLTDKGRDAIKQFDWLCETLNTSAEDSETGRA